MSNYYISLSSETGEVGTLSVERSGDIKFTKYSSMDNTKTTRKLADLVASANSLVLDPSIALTIVLDSAKKFDHTLISYEENAVVAAGQPEVSYEPKSDYTVTFDNFNNDTVLGLSYTDDDGNVLVRENGEWVEPVEDDIRFYGGCFFYTSENAVQLYDRLVSKGTTPVLDDFNEVRLD